MTPERLRTTHARRSAEDWALVLASQGIASELRAGGGRWELWVEGAQQEAALRALDHWERENTAAEKAPGRTVMGRSIAGVWVGAALVLFATFTGPAVRGTSWFRRGAADSTALLGGEVWRAVTALTLHLDAAHVLGNALACAIFVSWLGQRLGAGIAGAAVLAAGALGNAANALWHGAGHRSIGASTALFGALGVLSGLEAGRRFDSGPRRAHAWLPLAAGLALLAMLGTGRGSDVGAHAFGLGCGALIGLALARAGRASAGAQWLAGASAAGSLLAAWWLALRA
jgi:membrane associated rhomboid family serine protease